MIVIMMQVRLKQCHEGRDESFDTFILDEDKVRRKGADREHASAVLAQLAITPKMRVPRKFLLYSSSRVANLTSTLSSGTRTNVVSPPLFVVLMVPIQVGATRHRGRATMLQPHS